MKQYKIPIIYQSCQEIEVEADSLSAAVYQALKIFLAEPDENYLINSFEIDSIVDDEYPNEEFDIHQIMQNI